MRDIAIFNNTNICVFSRETQFNVSTNTIKRMRKIIIYIISRKGEVKRAKVAILTMASVVIVISTVSGNVKGVKLFW